MRSKTFRCAYGNRLKVDTDGCVQVIIRREDGSESNSLAVWLSRGELLALSNKLRRVALAKEPSR